MVSLHVLESAPEGLFTAPATSLHHYLDGPSLIHIAGALDPPLFISVLLHGNETSGWNALARYLRHHPVPGRSLMVFIGNIEAAATGHRALADQPDYNRIWKDYPGPEGAMAGQLLALLRERRPLAALDIHNNTGRNPHYSVLTSLSAANQALAFLFSDKAVYVEEPDTVLSRALHDLCPAITVEVGPVGDPASDERTFELLQQLIELTEIPSEAAPLNLYRALARVHLGRDVQFDFADEVPPEQALLEDLILTGGMEAVNFHALAAGFEFGTTRTPLQRALQVLDPQHNDVTGQFMEEIDGVIRLRRSVVPAMYTTDHDVIRQDCLCYFMERIT